MQVEYLAASDGMDSRLHGIGFDGVLVTSGDGGVLLNCTKHPQRLGIECITIGNKS